MTTSNTFALEQCWDDLQYPQFAVIEQMAWRFISEDSEEGKDIFRFTSQYHKSVTYEQYNEVAFMYACFNLLYLGDDNF